MDKSNEVREFEIDFKKIFLKMRPKLILVVIATLLVGLMAGVVTHFFIEEEYSAKIKMYVYSNSDRVTTNSTITQNEITASQELVNTYIYILESDTVLNAVADDLGLDISAGSLRSMISAEQAQDTVAFEVTVTTTSAKWSAKIANSIAKIAPAEIVRVVKAGGVEIIDYAKEPKRPSSPNLQKNVLIGAILGFVLSFGGFFAYELFDTSVSSASDLEREFSYPILGDVPRLGVKEKKKSAVPELEIDEPAKSTLDPPNIGIQPSDTIINNLKAMKGDEQ